MVLASIVDVSRQRTLERQLAHAERLAAIGQLAAGVAHEINTPLANISLVAESVRRKASDPALVERMDAILSQVDASARIVRGLLDFSSRKDPIFTDVDTTRAITEAIEFVRAKVPPDVEFRFQAPAAPLTASGDAGQLRQVLTNLYRNASEAMAGRGTITTTVDSEEVDLRGRPEASRARWVRIMVEDTGPGISADHLTHIFEPFFTTKSDSGGTGLGLSVVHGIIVSFGGRIEAENGPTGGSRFILHLPSVRGS